jgi:hypothetical protein
MGCWAFFFFLKGHHLGFCQKPFAASKAQNIKIFVKIRRCFKSHAAPFNLLFHNISTLFNGATESLAPYKWCYENQKSISFLTILLIGAANW